MPDMNHVEPTNRQSVKTVAALNIIAGIWLFVSPWVYNAYHNGSAWNSWIVGAVIVLFAAIRFSSPGTRALSVLNMLLGAWTFASPWIYGYTGNSGRFINSLCVGVVVFILGAFGSSMTRTAGHPTTHGAPPPLRP